MVKTCEGPVQVAKTGVTVTVATTGELLTFTAVNEFMVPVPDAASPIEGVVLVQLYVVPATVPVKLTVETAVPAHTTWSAGSVTVGIGLTVITVTCEGPVHPFAVGITVILAVCTVVPALVAVKPPMLPDPDEASPMLLFEFVQPKKVPVTGPV